MFNIFDIANNITIALFFDLLAVSTRTLPAGTLEIKVLTFALPLPCR